MILADPIIIHGKVGQVIKALCTTGPQNYSWKGGSGDQGTMLLLDPRIIHGKVGQGIKALCD